MSPHDNGCDEAQLLTAILDSSLDGIMAFSALRDENGDIVDLGPRGD